MQASLERDYGEQAVFLGLAGSSVLVEVFLSPSGTWTIVVTSAEGVTCLVAAGRDGQIIREMPEPDETTLFSTAL